MLLTFLILAQKMGKYRPQIQIQIEATAAGENNFPIGTCFRVEVAGTEFASEQEDASANMVARHHAMPMPCFCAHSQNSLCHKPQCPYKTQDAIPFPPPPVLTMPHPALSQTRYSIHSSVPTMVHATDYYQCIVRVMGPPPRHPKQEDLLAQ